MPYAKSMTTTTTPAPRRKRAALIGVISVGVLLIVASGLFPGGGHAAPTSPSTPRVSASTVPAPTPVQVTSASPVDELSTFEKENAISYPEVTHREIRYGNSLWVYTTLHRQLERAEEICGGYSLYVLVDPKVRTTLVRADDGYGLAVCGPGA